MKYAFFADHAWLDAYVAAQVALFAVGCNFAVPLCRKYVRCSSCDWRRVFGDVGGLEAGSLCVMARLYFQVHPRGPICAERGGVRLGEQEKVQARPGNNRKDNSTRWCGVCGQWRGVCACV